MKDDELIERLLSVPADGNGIEDVCGYAADRIEQLVREHGDLVQAQESLVETLSKSGQARKDAEAKLAKAMSFIKRIYNCAPDGDDDQWHILLDDAQYFITELEKK